MASEIDRLKKEKFKAESKGQWREVSALCNCIGQELCHIGQTEEALSCHKEELKLCTKLNDQLGIAVANRRLGECYSELGNFRAALSHEKTYLDIVVALKSSVEEQRAWATLGRTYYLKYLFELESGKNEAKKESLDKAEQSFIKGLELSEYLKKTLSPKDYAEMRGRVLLNLGLVYEQRGNLVKCAESIRQAIFLTKKYNLNEDLHRCQYSLATVYQRREQVNFALRLIDEAIASAKLLRDKAALCESLLFKANILIILKDFGGVKTYLKKAYRLHSPIEEDHEKAERHLKIVVGLCNCETQLLKCDENQYEARKALLEKMGDGLATMQNYKLAVEYYICALECIEMLNAPDAEKALLYFSIAQTYADAGQYKEALEYFEKEVECNKFKPEEQIKTLLKMAEVSEQNENYIDVEQIYMKAVSIAESLSNPRFLALCLYRLAELQERYNEIDKAQSTSEKLKTIKIEDQISFDEESEDEDSQDLFSEIRLSELSESTDSDVEREMHDLPRKRRRTKCPFAKKNELGETPLHRACITGNFKVVKQLIENGHPVNARDNCGWLPLHEATNHGYYEIVNYLLEHGAWVNDRGGKLCEGTTPLHDAASCGHLDVMQLLISKGASVTALNNDGESSLDSLIKWRKRSEDDLDKKTFNECKKIENELKKLIKQAGKSIKKMQDHSNDLIAIVLSDDENNCSQGRANYIKNKDKRSRSPPESCDDEWNELSYRNLHANLKTERNWDDPDEAKSEYCAAISNLRRSAKNIPLKPIQTSEIHQVSALLDEDDIVNDWLIDDMNEKHQTSKRKRFKASDLYLTNKSKYSNNLLIENRIEGKKFKEINVADEVNNTFSERILSSKNATPNNSSLETHAVSEPHNIKHNCSSNIHFTVSSSDHCIQSFCLRIRISDKVILVPVTNESCTVGWLAEEASQRYYNIVGVKPHLTLTTKDGALLSDSDLIKTVLRNNEEAVAIVNSWDQPSLFERYEQACQKQGITAISLLKKRLQFSESTSELCLANITVPLKQLKVVFDCLRYHETLCHLNLSCTVIADNGFQYMIPCFPSFVSLLSLNLKCCCLTSVSLKYISDFLSSDQNNQKFPKLKSIDFSYNFFGPECAIALSYILGLPSLVALDLTACNLTSSFFLDKNFCDALKSKKEICEINVSENFIDIPGVAEFLSFLPRESLTTLDLSRTVQSEVCLGRHVSKYFSQAMPCLSKLYLQGCFLTDEDLDYIANSLHSCPVLSDVNLSSNPSVSIAAVTKLVEKANDKNIPLHTLCVTGCNVWDSDAVACFSNALKLQLLRKVLLDHFSEQVQRLLFDAWKSCWGRKAICVNGMLCELKVQEVFS